MKTLFAPLAVVMALTFSSTASAYVTRWERAGIRYEARDLRREVRQAGPQFTPSERAGIRYERRDLRREVRGAVWH
jgi:hypothetical protein